ncbi:MAG TPA: hypothetical protein VGG28_18795 [Kofleriaceae bacterium]|jgi:DNA-binding response OmpR family regulator
MKVLIASSDSALRARLTEWLVAEHYDVVEADCLTSARRALEGQPHVVVVDWLLAGGGEALLGCLRAHDARRRYYVIAVCAQLDPAQIAAIVAAGADDFSSASASREEMLARVDALRRVRDRTPPKATHTQTIRIRKLLDHDGRRVWREIDTIITAEIGEMLGMTLEPEPRADATTRWCGAVPLTLNGEHLELQLGVGIAGAEGERFAHDVLGGEATDATIADALREIANVAGGAVKRAALGDGLVMTIGMPTDDDVVAMANARRWASATSTGLRLTFALAVAPAQTRSLRCCELREGFVVTRDVLDGRGNVVVTAGTRLTATSVERLTHELGADVLVEGSSRCEPATAAA